MAFEPVACFVSNDRPDFRQAPPRPVNAELMLALVNRGEDGLGRPLPAGILRVYETGRGGVRIFAGEDRVSHTPVDATFELRLGTAFDVTAESRTLDFQRLDKTSGSYETARGVTLKNAKSQPVEVEVVAFLPRGWRLLDENHGHEALDAQRVRWRVAVPAGGQSDLEYRIQVTP